MLLSTSKNLLFQLIKSPQGLRVEPVESLAIVRARKQEASQL